MSNDDLDVFTTRLRRALDYTNQIVVEADGYPMEHSAADMRTLLLNAFLAGCEAGDADARPPLPKVLEVKEKVLARRDTRERGDPLQSSAKTAPGEK